MAPLQQYMQKFGRDKAVSAERFANDLYGLGFIAPRIARKTIASALQEKPDMIANSKKKKINEIVNPALNSIGRYMFVIKLTGVITAAFLALACYLGFIKKEVALVQESNIDKITLTIEGADLELYPGEEWFNVVRENCGSSIINGRIKENSLASCLSSKIKGPILESDFFQYLTGAEIGTVTVTEDDYEEHQKLINILDSSKPLNMKARSSFGNDNDVAWFSPADWDAPNYAEAYCRAYGFNVPSLPQRFKDIYMLAFFDLSNIVDHVSKDDRITLYRVIDQREGTVHYVPFDMKKVEMALRMKRIPGALGLVYGFQDSIKLSADKLFKYNPDIPKHLLELMFYRKLLIQGSVLMFEDPWQDINACRYSGCQRLKDLEKALEGYEYGIKVADKYIRPPWELATKLRVPLERQAFGTYSTVFGLFKEAVTWAKGNNDLLGLFSADEVDNEKQMLKMLFDKPTESFALVIHFLITREKEAVFSDKNYRVSPIVPPFIRDQEFARQLALIGVVDILTSHPERGAEGDNVASIGNMNDFQMMLFAADLMGLDNPFPTFDPRIITVNMSDGMSYRGYCGVEKDRVRFSLNALDSLIK